MSNFCEIPFVSATALDKVLTPSGSGISALQKYRQLMRKELDPGLAMSLGRGGMMLLTSVALQSCVITAARCDREQALKLVTKYKKAGFARLKKSKDYKFALRAVSQAVRERLRGHSSRNSNTLVTELIPECWRELSVGNEFVRVVTVNMRDILGQVDEDVEQMRRLPGKLVRFEGKDGDVALLSIKNGERDELRVENGQYLRTAGIRRNGTPFILQEYSWSPDTKTNVYFPAMDLDFDAKAKAELMEVLDRRTAPLPRPAEGSLRREPMAKPAAAKLKNATNPVEIEEEMSAG